MRSGGRIVRAVWEALWPLIGGAVVFAVLLGAMHHPGITIGALVLTLCVARGVAHYIDAERR
jgi:hypothetical protein